MILNYQGSLIFPDGEIIDEDELYDRYIRPEFNCSLFCPSCEAWISVDDLCRSITSILDNADEDGDTYDETLERLQERFDSEVECPHCRYLLYDTEN